MLEHHAKPGDFIIGADSHTCTYGAIGALSIGMGSTDVAVGWIEGKVWIKVPSAIKIRVSGKWPWNHRSPTPIAWIKSNPGVFATPGSYSNYLKQHKL